MNWTQYTDKPLVFFESPSVRDVCQHTAYQPSDEVEAIFKPDLTPQDYFFRLLEQEDLHKEAITFMSAAMNQRVRVWWGYLCVQETMDEVKAKSEAKPDSKKMVEEAAADPAHAELMNFKLEDHLPPPMMHNGVNLNDPKAWPPPKLDPAGNLVLFPEPIHSDPNRAKLGIEEFFSEKAAAMKKMTPRQLELFNKVEQAQRDAFSKAAGGRPIDSIIGGMADEMNRVKGPKAKSPFASLEAKFGKSEAAITGKLDEMKKHIADMRKQLPKKSPPKEASSPRALQALSSAKDWVLIPSDENARDAFQVGKQCKNAEKPAGLLAQSAFWSGTNIAPPGTQPVPPPPPLAARGISTSLILASNLKGGTRKPPERLVAYLVHGIRVAQGIETWEDKIIEQNQTHPWAGRTGFGRGYGTVDENSNT